MFLAAVAQFAILSPMARADSAPDWLHDAAAEKIPDYPHPKDRPPIAVVLLDEQQITVKDNGDIETRLREAVRILRPEAIEEWKDLEIPFDAETKVSYLHSWTITPEGRELATKDQDVVEAGYVSDMMVTDVRAKMLKLLEVRVGSVIGFEFVQRKRPYVFEDRWVFQGEVPVHTSRLMLRVPAGWEYTAQWFNHREYAPQSPVPNQFVWEVHDLTAVDDEPDMPPWKTVAGWMGLKFFPRDSSLRSKSVGSWNDIGLWYSDLTKSSRAPSPQIQQEVTQLTANLPDTLGKIRALTDYMRKVRYFAVEIGIGGYRPHSAAEVFENQYGDCKDKVTLLSAMLQLIGVDSYYTIVDDERGFILENYPSLEADHMILAIRVPDGVPDTVLYATVNDPQLGRLLFFDPTNQYVPLGYLPWYLQDGVGLVVGPGGGRAVRLPLLPPATNRLLRQAEFSLDPSGGIAGDVAEIRWGAPASNEREDFLEATPVKRQKIIEDFLGGSLGNFTLVKATVTDLDQYDKNLTLNYQVVSGGYAKVAGDLLIVRPRVIGEDRASILRLLTKEPRQYPLQLQAATRQDDVFDIKLPPGYILDELPAPVTVECPYASYKSEVSFSGDTLHFHRTYEVKDVTVPTEKLSDFQAFLRQISADENSQAVFRKTTP